MPLLHKGLARKIAKCHRKPLTALGRMALDPRQQPLEYDISQTLAAVLGECGHVRYQEIPLQHRMLASISLFQYRLGCKELVSSIVA